MKRVYTCGSAGILVSLSLCFWSLRAYVASIFSPSDIDSIGGLIISPAKGASRGREKGNERVVVLADFFFGRENVSEENGGIYQGPVYEVVEGLMGSGGTSEDTTDSICWESWIGPHAVAEKGGAIADTN